jgi:hypothetical protein
VKRVTGESELPTSLPSFTVGDHLLHSYTNFTRTLPVFRDPRDHLRQLLTINVDVLDANYRLPADPCGSHTTQPNDVLTPNIELRRNGNMATSSEMRIV